MTLSNQNSHLNYSVNNQNSTLNSNLHWQEASKNCHCPICDKPDWCYLGLEGNSIEIAICGREVPVPDGWVKFGETKDDRIKYRREIADRREKAKRPPQTREWVFYNSNEEPLAKKVRWDYEDYPKKIRRQYFVDGKWRWSLPKDTNKSEFEAQVMPLHFDEIEIAREIGEYIVIAEGETQVDAFREKGFVATWFLTNKLEDYHVSLFEGANVVIPVDRDREGIKKASLTYEQLKDRANSIHFIYPYPQSPLWDNVPKKDGLDMADYLDDFDMTPEEIKGMFDSDRRYFEKLYKMPSQASRGEKAVESELEDDKPRRLNKKQLMEFIRNHLNLKYNEMTKEIEIDGEVLNEEPYIYLLDQYNIDAGKETAIDMVMSVAKKNAYNPVKEYLESLKNEVPIRLDNLATRYLGTNDPYYDIYLKKTLIGAVARVYDPGCKVDTALVLQGGQGIGKSSFFDVLGGKYFDDSMGNGSDKDDLLILHQSWIQEWGEIDRILGKKQLGEVKQFLSKKQDIFREPYGRKAQRYNRHSIIVGSVNDAQFLNDPTGDRRFLVIPVNTDWIDIETLKQERDRIWASAVQAYQNGESFHLTREEQLHSNKNNQHFRNRDEWESIIEDYLNGESVTTIREILQNALDYDSKNLDMRSQKRVANCLMSMGWTRDRQFYQGKRQRVWIKKENGQAGQATPSNASNLSTNETPSKSQLGQAGHVGQDNSQSCLNTVSSEENKNSSSHTKLLDNDPEETCPPCPNDQNSHNNGNGQVGQADKDTGPSCPDIQPGDTIKHKRWDGKIVIDQVEEVEPYWNDESLRITHKSGSISSDSDDLLEVINQWGQIKWQR